MLLGILQYIVEDVAAIEFDFYQDMFLQQTLPQFYAPSVLSDVYVYKDLIAHQAVILRELAADIYDVASRAEEPRDSSTFLKIDYPYGYQHGLNMPTKRFKVSLALERFLARYPELQVKFSSALDMVNISHNVDISNDFMRRLLAVEEERIIIVVELSSSRADSVLLAARLFVSFLSDNAWLKVIVFGCDRREYDWTRVEDFDIDVLDSSLSERNCNVLYASIAAELNSQYEQFNPLKTGTTGQTFYSFDEKVVGFIFASEIDVTGASFDFPVTLYLVYSQKRNPPISTLRGFRNFQFLFDRRSGPEGVENYVLSHCDGLPETSIVNNELMYRINLIQGAGSIYPPTYYVDVLQTSQGVYISAPVYVDLQNYGVVFFGCVSLLTNIFVGPGVHFADRRKFMMNYEVESDILLETLTMTQTHTASYTVHDRQNAVTTVDIVMILPNFVVYRFSSTLDLFQLVSGHETCDASVLPSVELFGLQYCQYLINGVYLYIVKCNFEAENDRFCEVARRAVQLLQGTTDIVLLIRATVVLTAEQLTNERIAQFNLQNTELPDFGVAGKIILSLNVVGNMANVVLNRPVVQIDSGVQVYLYSLLSLCTVENDIFKIKLDYDVQDGQDYYFIMDQEINLHPQFVNMNVQYESIKNQFEVTGRNTTRSDLPLPQYCSGRVTIAKLLDYYYVQLNGFICAKVIPTTIQGVMVQTTVPSHELMQPLIMAKHFDRYYFDNQISILTSEIDAEKQRLVDEYWTKSAAYFDRVSKHVASRMTIVLAIFAVFALLALLVYFVA